MKVCQLSARSPGKVTWGTGANKVELVSGLDRQILMTTIELIVESLRSSERFSEPAKNIMKFEQVDDVKKLLNSWFSASDTAVGRVTSKHQDMRSSGTGCVERR